MTLNNNFKINIVVFVSNVQFYSNLKFSKYIFVVFIFFLTTQFVF